VIVGAYVDNAAPEHAAGAEWSLHDLMTFLATRGHDTRIQARRGVTRERGDDGVLVYSNPSEAEKVRHFQECDVMLTQLEASVDAQDLAFTYQTPLVQLIHSANQLVELGVKDSCRALVVWNANHVAEACSWWRGPSVTLHPPINYDRVRTDKPPEERYCTTLVNVSHNKGGATLFVLARELEERPFMGVVGSYGEQTMGPEGMPGTEFNPTPTGLPWNLKVFWPMPIREVFSYTRTLLVLSKDESYGRVAGEAIVSGIPVISTRTPGMLECMGLAARYIEDRGDLRTLARVVDDMYTPAVWEQWSAAATGQAVLNLARQRRDLHRLHGALKHIAENPPEMKL
jgi:hypothetical protein